MPSDQTDSSDGPGCVRYGCGIAGVLLAGSIVALSIIIPLSGSFSILAVILVPPLALLLPGAVLGFAAGKLSWKPNTRRWFGVAGKYMLVFAALCLVSAIGLTLRPGGYQFEGQVSAEGGMVGPVEVDSAMTVEVNIEQEIDAGSGRRYQRWSFVTLELLDENKEYLASFGGEFWQYAGYDYEGYRWEEGDETFEAGVQIPSPGTYFLRLETESNVEASELSSITVKLREQARWGPPTLLQAAGYVAFFLGLILAIIPMNTSAHSLTLQRDARIRFRDRTWVVRNRADYTFDTWRSEEWTLHSTDPGGKAPRYLEREYEADSPHEVWYWSTPVDLSALACAEEEAEEDVEAYVAAHEALPDMIVYEDERFRLNDSGTAHRDDASLSYHTYQELWKEDGALSITIEGDPSEELSAVVTERIDASDLEGLRKKENSAIEGEEDGDVNV